MCDEFELGMISFQAFVLKLSKLEEEIKKTKREKETLVKDELVG